jgi:thiamine monophosphate synthase
VDGFAAIVSLSGGVPCIAVGGVQPEDVAAVRAAGGAGVAVAGGILRADDIETAVRRYARG